jgi:hypothetical protein
MAYEEYIEAYDEKALSDYVDHIFPVPDYADYNNEGWQEEAKKELELVYGFEYTADELNEYTRLLLELANEVIEYDEKNGEAKWALKLDIFGIRKKVLQRKIDNLYKEDADENLSETQKSINDCLDDISSLLDSSIKKDLSSLEVVIEDAIGKIKDSIKINDLDNIKGYIESNQLTKVEEILNKYTDEQGKPIKTNNDVFDATVKLLLDETVIIDESVQDLSKSASDLVTLAKANVRDQIRERYFEYIAKRRYSRHTR